MGRVTKGKNVCNRSGRSLWPSCHFPQILETLQVVGLASPLYPNASGGGRTETMFLPRTSIFLWGWYFSGLLHYHLTIEIWSHLW